MRKSLGFKELYRLKKNLYSLLVNYYKLYLCIHQNLHLQRLNAFQQNNV